MAILAEELGLRAGGSQRQRDGSWSLLVLAPTGMLTEERIRKRRNVERGRRFFFGVEAQKGPGQSAEAPTQAVIDGPLQQGFLAEYELTVREWSLADVGWVSLRSLPDQAEVAAKQLAREKDRREWPGHDAPTLSDNSFLDDRPEEGFESGSRQGAVTGTPVAVDELHAPMLEFKTDRTSLFQAMEMSAGIQVAGWSMCCEIYR